MVHGFERSRMGRAIESPTFFDFQCPSLLHFFHASFSYGGEISMKAKVNNSTTITTHQNIPQQRLKSILSSRILFSISILFESVIGNNKLKKRKLSFTTMIFRASSLDLRAKILNLQFDLSWYKQTKEIGSRSDTLPRMEKNKVMK